MAGKKTHNHEYTPRSIPDDYFDRYNIPCRHNSSCDKLTGGFCLFRHPGTPPRVKLMTADLSSEPVACPVFGNVDTAAWWGVQGAETLAGFNVLEDESLAVPGMSLPALITPFRVYG